MNSADKIAGVQGSRRTITNHLGPNWEQTDAYVVSSQPLDEGMGTGHLNARRAVQQFSSGHYFPTVMGLESSVPAVGWSQFTISPGEVREYNLNSSVGTGEYITITLCWDRIVEHSGGPVYHYFYCFKSVVC